MSSDLIIRAVLLPLDVPPPNPRAAPARLADTVTGILCLLMWVIGAVCAGAAMVAAAALVVPRHRNDKSGEGFKALTLALAGSIVAFSAASLLTWVIV